tara:strand:+ start:1255 stop:2028 length:774 start_codon:yes stop_codon:yes gene_type:complete
MSQYEQQHKNLVASYTDRMEYTEYCIEGVKKELELKIQLLEKLKQEKQQIPAENPIIKKILPFLPYEINKIILDKLHIQKVIHKQEANLKYQMAYVMRYLNYYTETDFDNYCCLCRDIMRKQRLSDYWIGNLDIYKDARKYLNNSYETYIEILENNYEKDFYEKEILKSVENMNKLFNEWGEAQQPLMKQIDKLSKHITRDRNNKEITFTNITFKIFKSNGAINKKQFDLFIDYVKVYVETERNTILTNYGLEEYWY